MATGSDKLEKFIKENIKGIKFDTVANKKQVLLRNSEFQYDIILLSAVIPGNEDIKDVIFEAQWQSNCRIIYFAGMTKQADLAEIWALGVKDIIGEPINPRDVIKAINQPATYKESVEAIKSISKNLPIAAKKTNARLKKAPDAPPEVTEEAKANLNGLLKLLRQQPGETIEESLFNLEVGLNNLLTQNL